MQGQCKQYILETHFMVKQPKMFFNLGELYFLNMKSIGKVKASDFYYLQQIAFCDPSIFTKIWKNYNHIQN